MSNRKRVLILCSANSIRSQLAEGLWRELSANEWEVNSAGVFGAGYLHPLVIQVMREIGIDVGDQKSKPVEDFRGQRFDVLVTVCDNACQACPAFVQAGERLHWPMEDPTVCGASDKERLDAFRMVRNALREKIAAYLMRDQASRGDA